MAAPFADLLLRSYPRLLNFNMAVTEGVDWKFQLYVTSGGEPVDFTSVTFTCKVITGVGGTDVVTWTVSGNSTGTITGTLADATTAGTAGTLATKDNPRACLWYCVAAHSGGDKVQMWGPGGSNFTIAQAS